MSEILLIGNPKRRKKRKMSALQRKYFGGGKRHKRRAKSSHRRRRRTALAIPAINPHRRRRHARRHVVHVRRRSNPSFRSVTGSVVPTLKSGLIGAGGAIGMDLLWGYGKDYLPASIAGSAIAQYAAKLAAALLVGIIGDKVMRGKGRDLAVGATTVVLHDAIKAQLQTSMPSLKLGEYLTYAPTVGTMRRAGRLMSTGMSGVGEYLNGLPNTEMDMNYSGDYTEDGMSGIY